jgi:hypothetical protein
MKKYLFGLFAIALAIGFSAFTTTKAPSKNSGSDTFYWYHVENNLVVELLDQEEITKGEAMTLSGCPDEDEQPVCAAAYESAEILPDTPVEITEPERLVRRDF